MTTDEKKAKLEKMRNYLKSLSKEERQAIADKYGYHSIDGHFYSITNQCLLGYQTIGDHSIQGTFGGFNQWKKAGRVVSKGQHGFTIWVPIGPKDKDTDMTTEAVKYILITVFDISQTEPMNAKGMEMPYNVEPEPIAVNA
jgi:hypothetical protein